MSYILVKKLAAKNGPLKLCLLDGMDSWVRMWGEGLHYHSMSGGSAPSEMSLLTCNDGSFQVFQKFYPYGGLLLQNTKL